MNITIVSGGSGSLEIQKALFKYDNNINLNLIINGYDDGKSTGQLRTIFPNTLGISDFRKNQLIEYKLRYGDDEVYKCLNHRFTSEYPKDYLNEYTSEIEFKLEEIETFIIENINYFFSLKESDNLVYEDFSVSNIIYSSLLHKNNGNMEITLSIMKNMLKLKNNIFLNSSMVCNLKATTKNNKTLNYEYEIVDFNEDTDRIEDIYFEDNKVPLINNNTIRCILTSDIIIYSCGTQFSSLIPTYKTNGFNEAISNSRAKKYLILNCFYDNDIVNYNGDQLLDKINNYLDLSGTTIVTSNNGHDNLLPTVSKYQYMKIINLIKDGKHNGVILWKKIFIDYFKEFLNKKYIFDYDYTLYDKDISTVSEENIRLLEHIDNKIIVTNNSFDNLIPIKDTIIHSNISNIKHENNSVSYIDKTLVLNNRQKEYILSKVSHLTNIHVQDRITSISIKPIKDREQIIATFKKNSSFQDYNIDIMESGKTTIEFVVNGGSKRNTFIKENFINASDYTYISDINDIHYDKTTDSIRFFEINNIHKTNLFIKTIISCNKYDFCISVGGINSRMNINGPKTLVKHNGTIILEDIIKKIHPFANNIYICSNVKYKTYFNLFEQKIEYNNVKFLYLNSLDGSQDYPKGNGETIYQLLKKENITNKLFVLWGDIIISNHLLFEEMYNLSYDCNLLIPTIYEKDPYAYLNIDNRNNVTGIGYKKHNPIDYGYHDQCIFLFDTKTLLEKLEKITLNQYEELNLLDVVDYFHNIKYYQTKYRVHSFNTTEELHI